MIGLTWLRCRSSDPDTRRRALADLNGRDAIREAERIVSAEWIGTLEATTAADTVTSELLQRERLVFEYVARKRARAAERDRRRLMTLIRTASAAAPPEETVQPTPVDGPSGS